MGQSAPRPSDKNVRPRSLDERLKEVAERLKVEADGEPSPGQTAERSLHLSPGQDPWVSSTLLAVLIVVSLIPTATIGVMLWQGVITTPWSIAVAPGNDSQSLPGNDSQSLEAQQTSTPSPAAEMLQQDVEALSVTLTVPSTIEAEAGKESPFSITLNSADPPLRSIITIEGLPEGTTLSDGRPYGDGGWTLKPDEVSDLRLRLPKGVSGHTNLRIALVGADGSPIAGAATQLNVANPPISRPEEKELIAGLIAHGQKMIDVGYLAGARGYFKRAAEAGSADAALALGATYDPNFISDIGVKGIKGDLAEARAWYERARELGSVSAQEKLEDLNHARPVAAEPVPAR
jgi:hypothetical protein